MAASSASSQSKGVQTDPKRQKALEYHSEISQKVTFTEDTSSRDLLQANSRLKGRYQIVKKLKFGGFGQIYEALDTVNFRKVAIKTEDLSSVTPGTFPSSIEMEVLSKFGHNVHCPTFYDFFSNEKASFIVMQLLGPNLSQLKRKCCLQPARLSIACGLKVTVQCLWAIRGLHEIGYLHRDVKPANFVVGLGPDFENRIFMVDYGLCRNYLDKRGQLRPERKNLGFRGTIRNASLNAHDGKDLSRRDDMISLFYFLCDLTMGHLPWHEMNDSDAVAPLKRKFTPSKLLAISKMPPAISEFIELTDGLSFTDRPNYERIGICLVQALIQVGGVLDAQFDWQLAKCSHLLHVTPIADYTVTVV